MKQQKMQRLFFFHAYNYEFMILWFPAGTVGSRYNAALFEVILTIN